MPPGATQATIVAEGAGGGGSSGGSGGHKGGDGVSETGTFAVSSGQTLHVVVGQGGAGAAAGQVSGGGGGGGSFVFDNSNSLMIAAGGGGGGSLQDPGGNATLTGTAGDGDSGGGTGGSGGAGGHASTNATASNAGGGGGTTSAGGDGSNNGGGGGGQNTATTGGAGGTGGGGDGGNGGFGGGAGGADLNGGGGGGGYSGGGGGLGQFGGGGGGASFNNGTNPSTGAGGAGGAGSAASEGSPGTNGQVMITFKSATVTTVVNSNTDPGAANPIDCKGTNLCTLRDAVGKANTTGGTNAITFASSVTKPIVLNTSVGQLEVTSTSSENVTITGNGSTVIDGGHATRILELDAGATLALNQMTLRNGSVSGSNDGGAIFNQGFLTVNKSTMSGNSAGGFGGAILNNASPVTLTNSTLSGNSAGHDGGGIQSQADGTLTVINSTLAGNSATGGHGGGISNTTGSTSTVTNSIVADNPSSPNCSGTITDGGYNLENGTTCSFSNHAVNAEPGLGPLQNNGGPTQTQAILKTSPAFAKANNTVCTNASPGGAGGKDQRGFPRNNEFPGDTNQCDIGAYEAAPPTVSAVSPNSGPRTGGTPITITGTNFTPGAKVVIGQGNGTTGAIPATNVKVVSRTKITARTGGPAKAGTWRLFVITSAGTSAATAGDLFTYK